MRKRTQYGKPKLKAKIPTIIIMSVVLFLVLAFGKELSWSIAGFFAPNVPVTDAEIAVTDMPLEAKSEVKSAPSKTGTVIYTANKSAAQSLLRIIAVNK